MLGSSTSKKLYHYINKQRGVLNDHSKNKNKTVINANVIKLTFNILYRGTIFLKKGKKVEKKNLP